MFNLSFNPADFLIFLMAVGAVIFILLGQCYSYFVARPRRLWWFCLNYPKEKKEEQELVRSFFVLALLFTAIFAFCEPIGKGLSLQNFLLRSLDHVLMLYIVTRILLLLPIFVHWIIHPADKTEDADPQDLEDDGEINVAYRGFAFVRDADEKNTWLIKITEKCSNASKYKISLYKAYMHNISQEITFPAFKWEPFSFSMSITIPESLNGTRISKDDEVLIFINGEGMQVQFPTHGKGYIALNRNDSKA